ncbi:hypothetical protein PILCRDRAFT_814062 [Piloderma croceum F 1598]|uniref:Uncharacterized protein n=1 Tax=Piloderma croceum (strain F 1598) TaxID=765440 RepID=A0A0C3G8U0_PILCF|nr:hypothetical protein PILCRDRAFT_814062 [Piloderma croceum F 1598]
MASSRTRWSKLWNVLASADRGGDYTNGPHTWVRRVMISSQSLAPVSSCLFAFSNLQSLFIDFASEDVRSQDKRLKSIFQPGQPVSCFPDVSDVDVHCFYRQGTLGVHCGEPSFASVM